MNQFTVKTADMHEKFSADTELTLVVPPLANVSITPDESMWVCFKGDPEAYWFDKETNAWYVCSSLEHLCVWVRDLMLKGTECEISTNIGTIKLARSRIAFREREIGGLLLVSTSVIIDFLTEA